MTDDSAIVSVPAPLEPFDKLEDTVGRLVASVNARDVDGVMAEFSDRARATLISGRGEPDTTAETYDRSEIRFHFAGLLAEGTRWSDLACVPAATQRSAPTLRCSWRALPAIPDATSAPPVETVALVVGDSLINELHVATDDAPTREARKHFTEWLALRDPSGIPVAVDPESAAALGRYRATMLPQWLDFLDHYGCSSDVECTITVERWVAEYNGQCAALGESADHLSIGLHERMVLVPPTTQGVEARVRLMELDAHLLGIRTASDAGDGLEIWQERANMMAELGIDERCHPIAG